MAKIIPPVQAGLFPIPKHYPLSGPSAIFVVIIACSLAFFILRNLFQSSIDQAPVAPRPLTGGRVTSEPVLVGLSVDHLHPSDIWELINANVIPQAQEIQLPLGRVSSHRFTGY